MEFYFQNGLAVSTRKAYNSAKKRYHEFCASKGLVPLPSSEQQLCLFVSILASQNICHSIIKSYLAAVRHLHIAEGFGDPLICDMARLEQVLKGVKSVQSKEQLRRTARLPVTPELLAKLRGIWVSQPDGSMLWAAASLCFFGFLRSGEITVPSDSTFDEGAHLSFKDVAVDSFQEPRLLKVRIKASKTDPFRLGADNLLEEQITVYAQSQQP